MNNERVQAAIDAAMAEVNRPRQSLSQEPIRQAIENVALVAFEWGMDAQRVHPGGRCRGHTTREDVAICETLLETEESMHSKRDAR